MFTVVVEPNPWGSYNICWDNTLVFLISVSYGFHRMGLLSSVSPFIGPFSIMFASFRSEFTNVYCLSSYTCLLYINTETTQKYGVLLRNILYFIL